MVTSKFTYSRWAAEGDESYHIHSVSVASNSNKLGLGLNPFLLRFLFSGFASFYIFLLLKGQGNSIVTVLCSLSLLVLGLCGNSKTVEKESVLLMPDFGVELQSHYIGGKVKRRFIPVDKILKAVMVEHVTPLTCYWSLSLLMRGEDELTPVFKGLRPPVKMLVPIWEALCVCVCCTCPL